MFLIGAVTVAQDGSTRILYPKPDTAAHPAELEEESSRVLYPTPSEVPEEESSRVLYPSNPEEAQMPEPPQEPGTPVVEEATIWPEPEVPADRSSYAYPRRPRRKPSQTLLGDRGRCCGGYGAFSVNVGNIDNQSAIMIGGRGAWVMGGGFGLGFGGYALVNDVVYDDVNPGEQLQLEMAYGGLYLEPMVATRSPIHVSFPILLGVGGAIYTEDSFRYNDRFDWDRDVEDSDIFFVLEPGAYLEFHIVRFFRVGIGAQYRILGDLDLANTGSNDFNGWTGGLTLKFGNY